ncbi:MAG: NUDIX hydrolase N-terminal domain-containing protein [Anaerolineales bacterium]|nr:NUDIX hydrolase N-terminal domain-containing protein [Anaerolineales bacterium]HUV26615.1 NUDIX hydrolase N-terminal domain-containing protein [Anaerolineales bacterium]
MNTNSDLQEVLLPRWLEWAREIQSISQIGLHYAENNYQKKRYLRLLEISAQIISEYADVAYEDIVNIFSQQIGYATPRIDVRGAVFQAGNLLFVRERMDGGWTMPGGWVDVGDTPSSAVEREVFEESGFEVTARKVIGVYDANRTGPLEIFHAFKIVFLCDIVAGEASISDETSEVAFFSQSELPNSLSGERTRPRHIDDAFDALSKEIPTVFD